VLSSERWIAFEPQKAEQHARWLAHFHFDGQSFLDIARAERQTFSSVEGAVRRFGALADWTLRPTKRGRRPGVKNTGKTMNNFR
jgi:hypothetical protein